jgi:DNA-binding SARP family transcriptional activator
MMLRKGANIVSRLHLYLLGSPHLERDGAVVALDRHKALALLAYLALVEGAQSRDSLATLLWPDADQVHARGALRPTLVTLRQAVGGNRLCSDNDRVTLRRDPGLFLDVERFRSLLAQVEAHKHPAPDACTVCETALAEAAQLYRGDFMAGFSLRDAPEFDNWQTYQTESLRLALIEALERLSQIEAARGDYEAAIRTARRWLDQDPLCEEPHRALMRFFAASGNRSAALRQYDECAHILDEELGIGPDPETVALRDALVQGQAARPAKPQQQPAPLQLPPDRTPFIGRDAELAEVVARLTDPACRLLTVLGPGGSGKTRLAVQAARTQAGRFADGVIFVDLQPVQSPDLLALTIAQAVSVPATGLGDIGERLAAHLSNREMLLLLDNFEHLMEGVQLLPQLLDAAPRLRLLVTSRARLNLQEEWLLPLEGLGLPSNELKTAELGAYDATALFLGCASRLQPGFHPTPREAADITHACRLLDGMPLGIELAAARARMLPVSEIVAQLAHGLDVLATTTRDIPDRHRSMAAAITSRAEHPTTGIGISRRIHARGSPIRDRCNANRP